MNSESNIPKRHALLSKRTTPTRHPEQVAWIHKLRDLIGTGFIFGFVGPRGTGKTQIGAEVILYAEQKEKTGLYTTAFGMLLAVRASYKHSEDTEQDVIASFVRPTVLVIDECHERRGTDFENQIITHIIDKRYGAMKDTILISNQTVKEFDLAMGDSVVSRIKESGGLVECNWESFRK